MPDEMTADDLAPVPGLPNFILAGADNGSLVWWQPNRTGDDNRDYEAGGQCFDMAVLAIRQLEASAQCVLANIISGMRQVGPVERGFIDRLAAKATYACIPEPASDFMAASAADLSGGVLTVESIRAGESYAREMIEVARLAEAPFIIADDIADIVNGHGHYGGAGYIWTMCAAAGSGAAN